METAEELRASLDALEVEVAELRAERERQESTLDEVVGLVEAFWRQAGDLLDDVRMATR